MFALHSMTEAAELTVTQREIQMLQTLLADRVCHRCKMRYRSHDDADHYFFEFPEELPLEESN